MKLAKLFVSALTGCVLQLKSTVLLAAVVVAMGLFLGASAAAAPKVIFDQNNPTQATGIENLVVQGILFNVAFTAPDTTTDQVYGTFPGKFFTISLSLAQDSARAVNDALNAADALTVGAEGSGGTPVYRIGFDSRLVSEQEIVIFYEQTKEDQEPWRILQVGADSYQSGALWADFIEVPETPTPVTIGGVVTGLEGSGLVLQNNGADDEAVVPGTAPEDPVFFSFDTPLAPNSSYNVTVKTQPSNPAQTCRVTDCCGFVPSQPVTDVEVTCD